MKNLPNIKAYSLNVKVSISLFALALFLLTILFTLIVPKMQKEQYDRTIKEIEQVLNITKEQIKVAAKAIVMQSNLETKLNKKRLEVKLLELQRELEKKQDLSIKEIENKLKRYDIFKLINYTIKSRDKTFISGNKKVYNNHIIKSYNEWETYNTKVLKRDYTYTKKYLFFTIKIKDKATITIFVKESNLNKNHSSFEKDIKINVQNTFNTTYNLHKGKTYLMWINSKYKKVDDKPLFTKDLNLRKDKYSISNMSNVDNIYTGNLTPKEIYKAKNKGAVTHLLNNKEAISWIIDLSNNKNDKYTFLLVKTLYKNDLIKQINSTLLKILPVAIISLIIALVLGFFLFRRFFNNIKILDDKVEDKTKELKLSLEEKETLLKEIHHRVKNNLALTISFIKLQQAKIEDSNTKKILTDIQERIYTMELLHRKLYESTNLNSIPLNEYIKNLTNDIARSYKNKDLEVIFDLDEISVDIQTAMPIGLILNELITNSFKYAFKDNSFSKLQVLMKKSNDEYELIVKDNGKGFEKNFDIEKTSSLGLKLINSICKLQLKGRISYEYNQGAMFKIVFKHYK